MVVTVILLTVPSSVRADDERDLEPAPDPTAILMDFELNERLIVEQAAKTRTTIQQAPAIITVITAKEIRDRGYRTVNDVLSTIPGFEGDRWEFNGWLQGYLTRGLPDTALVLLDGVNIVGPDRNLVVLDRKIPLSIVKRIEVTSGPGSVLWGSNALLGVVNIITHDGRSSPGLDLRIGGGDGPGARASAQAHVSYGGTWFDDFLRFFAAATYYTTKGPELLLDEQKLLGPFPSPAPDGFSLLVPGSARTEPYARDHFLNLSGNLSLGSWTLGWNTGFEVEHRELGAGGGLMTTNYRTQPGPDGLIDGLVSQGADPLHTAYIRYNERFQGQTLGISAQGNFAYWQLSETPFGVYPRSTLLPNGGTTSLESDGTMRVGFNVDVDYQLPAAHRLLIGTEVSADFGSDTFLTSFHPLFEANTQPGECLAPFEYHPDRDPLRPCSVRELALAGTERVIGAVYATDEWKANRWLALNLGVRGQFSTTYRPTALLSGGLVVGLAENVFLKTTYSEGFRPPDFESTATASGIASGVTFEANPDLDVETSRAVETEINARLFENVWPIKQWYIRADYSFTQMEGVITSPAGRFENSGDRNIHSVEVLTKLLFYGDHELWLSYYFVDVIDSERGRLRNIANHVLNAGLRANFFDGHLQLSTLLTLRGSMQDLNRTVTQEAPGPPLVSIPGARWVQATGLEVTDIPTAPLLRVGIEGKRLFGGFNLSAWVYNVLNLEYSDPDYFFDDRIMSRPQSKPGLSFFLEASVQW